MKRLFANQRFALFAPFIALAAVALIAFGLWVVVAGRIGDELSTRGLSWQNLTREGFPARISLHIEKPIWRDPEAATNMVWQNSGLSLTVMPFKGGHAIIDFLGAHDITGDAGQLRLSHKGNLMSAVVDTDGLNRASFEARQADMNGTFLGNSWRIKAAQVGLHIRRRGDARHDIAWVTDKLSAHRDGHSMMLPLDAALAVPSEMLRRGAVVGDIVTIDRLTLKRDALKMIAKGRLKLGADGFVSGSLDMQIVNFKAFVDTLIEVNRVKRRERKKWLQWGKLLCTFLGGDRQNCPIPLTLRKKRIYLKVPLIGQVDLGRAPRWK